MVDFNLVNELGLNDELLTQQVGELYNDEDIKYLEEILQSKVDSRVPGSILKGKIVAMLGDDVIVEVGLKSEGVLDSSEFDSADEIEIGKEIEVLLEDTDSEGGMILLSKRKADRIRGWEIIIETKKEGDIVKGKVVRRIKGGLLVDIGVPVFLPASQVDIRKPGDISRFIGDEVECAILKIDIENRNIVVSRRKLIEEQRASSKEALLAEIEAGQLRKGIVKNIADFGVFVDLGGLDGLLHISDLSWGRISHPSEVVKLDDEIECVVIGVDKENEKVSLGLKQKTTSPWEDIENRYPIGAKISGKVVNVMNYGVFIRLEEGVEGLIHISEMSWTKRIAHPSEMLNVGDEVEAVVLNMDKGKQEISLGLKQTEINPWSVASKKYPAGTIVEAKVRSVTNYGVFVEIEPGIDGMIHISDLSWTKKFSHPSEAVQRDQMIKCVVLEVDEDKHRVSLGIKQMTEDPWLHAIPDKYIPGQIVKGKITKLTNFGVFVELETDLDGLLHISELSDHKIDNPEDVVKEGQEVEIKILRVDTESRKIGLSLRRAQWAAEGKEDNEPVKDVPEPALSDIGQGPKDLQETVEPEKAEEPEAKAEEIVEEKPAEAETKAEEEVEDKPVEADKTEEAVEEKASAETDVEAAVESTTDVEAVVEPTEDKDETDSAEVAEEKQE